MCLSYDLRSFLDRPPLSRYTARKTDGGRVLTVRQIALQQRKRALYNVFLQLVVTLIVALISWPFSSLYVSYSIVVGGLVCVLPALYFAFKFFSVTGALAARQIAHAMYRAEIGKLVLTGLLFVVVFTSLAVSVAPFFGGYVVALITGLCRGSKL